MLLFDPAKNRGHNAYKLASMVAKPQKVTFYTLHGQISGVLVAFQAAAITVSLLSEEARAVAPDPGVTELDSERITVGFVLQRANDSDSFMRGVLNTATGEGLLELCDSPVRANTGGVAIAVNDGQPGFAIS